MISIPSGIETVYKQAVDALLTSELTSESCSVYYPPKKVACNNCVPGPFGGSGGNTYRSGGPAPFSFGQCPLCQGKGFKESETSDTIRLRVYFIRQDNRLKTFNEQANINFDQYDAQIIGYTADLPKVNRANYLTLVDQEKGNQTIKVRLITSPVPWGFGKDKYFTAYVAKI
jgi:hypothetical protein